MAFFLQIDEFELLFLSVVLGLEELTNFLIDPREQLRNHSMELVEVQELLLEARKHFLIVAHFADSLKLVYEA